MKIKDVKRSIAIGCVLLAMVGCGTKFIYSNLDWIVIEYVDDYVSLSRGQEEILSDRIELLSHWHKKEELPIYLRQLDTIREQDPSKVSTSFVAAQMTDVRAHGKRLVEQMTPDLYALTQQLSDEQVDELVANLAKKDKKLLEKYQGLDEQAIRSIYQERIESSFERWYGQLTDEHQNLAYRWSQEMTITVIDWQMHRENMQRYVDQLLRRRNDIAYYQPEFQRFMNDPDSYYTDALVEKIQKNRAVAARYIAQSLNTLSSKQQQHLAQEIDDWRDIATDLMATTALDYSPTALIVGSAYNRG
ncbi:DUF6279 family lipoprotein [Vibrio methylphosphonaticus]|uniref:DUF6279 family lipoprotein n=1 Tax=Vibrio methylphosphonaticus TaxID=2946866 RepID=UPI00202A313C|nr:DUF6279 family lipoprotein [Vibrio methylphosphonaticus]MCL9773951.1 DUF6279 family lipoprotein [Vibrio methylphosphonaticus]